jgi:TatD DNase family protein
MPPTWIDTHAHLDDPQFATDLPAVLDRARAAGVSQVITIATTYASSAAAVALAGEHREVWATVGIQPNHVAEAVATDWDDVVRLVRQPRVVALGETGLDRYWDRTPFSQQEDYFARHLELAHACELPVVIHCREAEVDVVRMLRERFERTGPIRGVMHSFTGDRATAEACLAMGLRISFAGMVTYKNAEDLRQVATLVPSDRLLVETDSPYLTPVPLRGKVKRNEPLHVIHTGACLAAARGVPPGDLARQTSLNARELFRLLEAPAEA